MHKFRYVGVDEMKLKQDEIENNKICDSTYDAKFSSLRNVILLEKYIFVPFDVT